MIATARSQRAPVIRLTARQRRDAIVEAAVHEFARNGFDGSAARTPGPAVNSLLAEQAMLTVTAAMDLPEARSCGPDSWS